MHSIDTEPTDQKLLQALFQLAKGRPGNTLELVFDVNAILSGDYSYVVDPSDSNKRIITIKAS
jgi:hypothetical protein